MITRTTVEIIIFSRAPIPGAAKRRLIPALGAEGAAALQARMTAHIVKIARHSVADQVTLWGAPDTSHPLFARLAETYDVRLMAQQGADLGVRMHFALHSTLLSAARAIIIGSDCPALDVEDINEAVERLNRNDAVLGAARDGGYVLLGLCKAPIALFEGVQWGTDAVLGQTRKRFEALGWTWSELGPFPDIDRPEDLQQLPHWMSARE